MQVPDKNVGLSHFLLRLFEHAASHLRSVLPPLLGQSTLYVNGRHVEVSKHLWNPQSRACPLGHGHKRTVRVPRSQGEIGIVELRWVRALKACPERSEGRRLGEDASPEGS